MWKRSSWEARPATAEELSLLQADLAKDKRYEQVDLSKSIVVVTTFEGEIAMYGAARLIWQIEPIKWMHRKRGRFSPFQRRFATWLTFRWLREWLADPRHNPLIRSYFALISDWNREYQKLAETGKSKHFSLRRLYRKVKFYGEDL